ncbi:MAG: tetratricopeptide repeat protein, partial [Alphaproteobacteria bacterium]
MLGSYRLAFLALIAAAFLLIGCATDPITDSLRPNPEDVANHPGAPAGSVAALVRVGEASRQSGDPVTAITLFRRAHNLDPFKVEPLVKLGDALNDVGKFSEAADSFRTALEYEHNNVEALRGLGTALIGLNQPGLAIDHFKAALAIEPDYRSYNGLGVASDHMGQHKAAQDYYEAGLKGFPKNLTLLNNLGLSQLLTRDYDAAMVTLVTAAEQPGATARQRLNLALAYGLAGRDAEAQRIARIDLDDKTVQDNLAYYGILRAADDAALLSAILGVHVPVPPPSAASQPDMSAPASIQPKAGGGSSVDAPVNPQAADNPAAPPDLGVPNKAAGEATPARSGSGTRLTANAPDAEAVQPVAKLTIKPVMRVVTSSPESSAAPEAPTVAQLGTVVQTQTESVQPNSGQTKLPTSSAHIAASAATVQKQATEFQAAEKPTHPPAAVSASSNPNDSDPAPKVAAAPIQASTPQTEPKSQQTAMVTGEPDGGNAGSRAAFKQDSDTAGPGAWYVQQVSTNSDAGAADKWKPVTSFFDQIWNYFFKPPPATATASADTGSSAGGAAV